MTFNFTASELLEIISVAATNVKLRYFSQPQNPKQRIYPSVEISHLTTKNEDVTPSTIIKTKQNFNIDIFMRYDVGRRNVTADLEDAETKILAVLKNTVIQNTDNVTGNLNFYTQTFQRSKIKDNPNNIDGVQSTLLITVEERSPTEAGVSLGDSYTITIGTITDALVYDKPLETERSNFESVFDTARVRKRVVPLDETHAFYFSIGHTAARATELRTLKRNRAKITITFKRNNVSESKTGWITEVSNGAVYEGIETLVVEFQEVH